MSFKIKVEEQCEIKEMPSAFDKRFKSSFDSRYLYYNGWLGNKVI